MNFQKRLHVPSRRRLLISALGSTALLATGMARAQQFPSKPIRIVVPTTPGVVPDVLARVIGQRLAEIWGAAVVIDNRPGASQIIGTSAVTGAEADGYTLLFGDTAVWGINPHVYQKLPYEPFKDLAPVIQAAITPVLLTVNSNFPATTVEELIAYAKANPRKVNYATPGIGSSGHLSAEMFSLRAGVELTHVPYKGIDGIQALSSGDVQLAFFGLAATESHVKAGKMRYLATTTPSRLPAAPTVPTLSERNIAFDLSFSMGVLAPAKTPRAVISKLNTGLAQAIADPAVTARLVSLGIVIPSSFTPEAFGASNREENRKFGELVKVTGLRLD